MRVFVNNIDHLRIFDIFQIFKSFVIRLLTDIVHDNHLKIIFPISKANQILYPSMRLHNQIDQLLINNIQIGSQQILKLSLLLF